MPKIHPNATPEAEAQVVSERQSPSGQLSFWRTSPSTSPEAERQAADRRMAPAPLTVWRKSLLFNCNGFTVFDAKGSLVFRVDNYLAGNSGKILLMDGGGKPLLTIRRKGISIGSHWLIFNGEDAVNPRFSVTKPTNLFTSKTIARVSSACGPRHMAYVIEGSYARRSCSIYDSKRQPMAEIQRKEGVAGVAYGQDIFRLVIQPEFEMPVAMSLVIILEQMFRYPSIPLPEVFLTASSAATCKSLSDEMTLVVCMAMAQWK
ncbi:hypothetical protein ACLOJK_031577 [Asimina triloba]